MCLDIEYGDGVDAAQGRAGCGSGMRAMAVHGRESETWSKCRTVLVTSLACFPGCVYPGWWMLLGMMNAQVLSSPGLLWVSKESFPGPRGSSASLPPLYMSVLCARTQGPCLLTHRPLERAFLLEEGPDMALTSLRDPVNSVWVGLTCVCGGDFLRRSFPRPWASLITSPGLWLLPALRALETG